MDFLGWNYCIKTLKYFKIIKSQNPIMLKYRRYNARNTCVTTTASEGASDMELWD